jgi:arylsulfatase A-like enzyme
MPHVPLYASESFRGKSKAGLYGDTIEELDWSVGQILGALREHGVDEKTLVIYTSDNGPWDLRRRKDPRLKGGSALPLRGYKFQTLEGGMRVPAIMRWPDRIPAGTVCSEVASTIDMLPTIAALTGSTLPAMRPLDGKDISDLMTGQSATGPHEIYCYYREYELQAVRSGTWKLLVPEENQTKRNCRKAVELYDLATDIGETQNVADLHPDVVKMLEGRLRAFDRELKEDMAPVPPERKERKR